MAKRTHNTDADDVGHNAPAAEWLPLDALVPHPRNPRVHGDEVTRLARTILRTAWGAPIVAQWRASGRHRVIAGHGRLLAAREILRGVEVDGEMRGGAEHRFDPSAPGPALLPVRVVRVSDAEADAMTLADNARSIQGDDSAELIVEMAAQFGRDAAVMADIGFDGVALDALVKSAGDALLSGAGGSDGDAARHDGPEDPPHGEDAGAEELPPDAPVMSRTGEVYELGPHRLVCGDSRDAATWALLLGGERPPCMITDPPYGMSYKGRVFGTGGLSNDGGEFAEVLRLAVLAARAHLAPDALAAACFGTSRLDRYFASFVGSGFSFLRLLTIYKPNSQAYPWRGWILTSEVIGLWSAGEPAWPDAADHCHDVYRFDYSERPDRDVDHPTVKPLSIIADLVAKLSPRASVVADPFAGSGTTLIACAQTGRVARLIELDPRYCDVIRRRWTKYARSAGIDPGAGALD